MPAETISAELRHHLPKGVMVPDHLARVDIEAGTIETHTPIFFAMDAEAVQMHITPGEDDPQCGMEGGKRHITADEEAAPDQWANALHDLTESINVGWESNLFHRSTYYGRANTASDSPQKQTLSIQNDVLHERDQNAARLPWPALLLAAATVPQGTRRLTVEVVNTMWHAVC